MLNFLYVLCNNEDQNLRLMTMLPLKGSLDAVYEMQLVFPS